jgi:uncharacterized membrane protein
LTREAQPVALWARVVTLCLSLVGLGLSIYLTIEHFGHSSLLVCPSNSVFNCGQVTTSAQSYVLGIPVAVLGLIGYCVLTALNTPWAWRAKNYYVHVARFVLTIGSMAFVLWLICAELVIIGYLCLYCTAVHAATFALFVVMMRVAPTQLGKVRLATTE